MLTELGIRKPKWVSKWDESLTESIADAQKSVEATGSKLSTMENSGKHNGRQSLYEVLDVQKSFVRSLESGRSFLRFFWK